MWIKCRRYRHGRFHERGTSPAYGHTAAISTTFVASTQVKVLFFGSVGFGRVGTPDVTADGVLQVASLADLMATKLKVILQRAEAKDYRDIAAMLSDGASLSFGLASARQIFGPNFQPSECLKALTYFNDGDLSSLGADEKLTLVDASHAVRELPVVEIRSGVLVLQAC